MVDVESSAAQKIPSYKKPLIDEYVQRNVTGVLKYVEMLSAHPKFQFVVERLVKEGKVESSHPRVEQIAKALVAEIEPVAKADLERNQLDSFYLIAEDLKQKFSDKVGEIYLETMVPTDLVQKVRFQFGEDRSVAVSEVLSAEAVERHKEEAIRVEKSRQAMVVALQPYSNFPIKNALLLAKNMEDLHEKVRASYQYLSLKPAFIRLAALGQIEAGQPPIDVNRVAARHYPIFANYLQTGMEPSLADQIEMRSEINQLVEAVEKTDIVPSNELGGMKSHFSTVWRYRSPKSMEPGDRYALEEVLNQLNTDKHLIFRALARTFVEEFKASEQEMWIIHNQIKIQLADTVEFLSRLETEGGHISEEDLEKVRVGQEKVIGLDGIFDIDSDLEKARKKPYMQLERTALGVFINITADQLVRWIQIYSIIFSNSDFLKYAKEKVDLERMRIYISDLASYHLIQNVALLRTIVDRSLQKSDQEKQSEFKRFNDALKLKLQGLMGGKPSAEKSLSDMIRDLGFIGDKSVQFAIADTYKGFQNLVDAFSQVSEGYFVKDKQALESESRSLYEQICTKCLKNFVHVKPAVIGRSAKAKKEKSKKGFFSGLFSRS